MRHHSILPFRRACLAAVAALACLPGWSHAADDVVTNLTSLHYSGPDIASDEGPPRGWPRAGYPLTAPTLVQGVNGSYLYLLGGLGSALVRAFPVPAQYTTLETFGVTLRDAARALFAADHERAAFATVSPMGQLVQRANGDLIGVVRVVAMNTSQWSVGQPVPYRVIETGLMFRMDFDGANPRLLPSTKDAALIGPMFTGVLAAAEDGSVYALQEAGAGAAAHGRIVRLGADDTFSVVHEFEAPPTGLVAVPNGMVLGSDGVLYGVLGYDRGVPGAQGTPVAADTPTGLVYSIDPTVPGSFKVLYRMTLGQGEFASVRASTANVGWAGEPPAYVQDGGDGWLYGTAGVGHCSQVAGNVASVDGVVWDAPLCGVNVYLQGAPARGLGEPPAPRYDASMTSLHGMVFRVRKDGSGTMEVVHRFSGADGSTPRGELALGADGAIYGTTLAGGANSSYDDQARVDDSPAQAELRNGRQRTYLVNDGVLWRVQPGTTPAFEVVHHFAKSQTGKKPLGLRSAADGRLYGATARGGGAWVSSIGESYADDIYGSIWSYGAAAASSVTLSIAPAEISAGGSTELTWTSTGVRDCTANSLHGDWTGAQPTEGSVTLADKSTGTYNYTLMCLDTETGGQVVSDTVRLFVGAPASDTDGNNEKYGNGGAASLALLSTLAWLAVRRRAGRRSIFIS